LRIRRKNLWLCLPIAVTGLGDGFLTLVGNSITGLDWGWETNPAWRWLLHRGALAFGLAFMGYLVVIGMIVAYAPLRLSKVLCVAMVLAHSYGIVSWLHLTRAGYFLDPLVYTTIAAITIAPIELGASPNGGPAEPLGNSGARGGPPSVS
jgi:hypothetical protein